MHIAITNFFAILASEKKNWKFIIILNYICFLHLTNTSFDLAERVNGQNILGTVNYEAILSVGFGVVNCSILAEAVWSFRTNAIYVEYFTFFQIFLILEDYSPQDMPYRNKKSHFKTFMGWEIIKVDPNIFFLFFSRSPLISYMCKLSCIQFIIMFYGKLNNLDVLGFFIYFIIT